MPSLIVPVGTRQVIDQDCDLLQLQVEGELEVRRRLCLSETGATGSLLITGVISGQGRILVVDEVCLQAPETKIDLRTKLVLRDSARSEVRGRIVVARNATGSRAFQRIDHLQLGDNTLASGIPELEVETNDVICGHAATTSRPDETHMFYLATRGLSQLAAENLLAEAFLVL